MWGPVMRTTYGHALDHAYKGFALGRELVPTPNPNHYVEKNAGSTPSLCAEAEVRIIVSRL